MWVKICGITSLEDARAAVEVGADAIGFIFADSPRRVTAEAVRGISSRIGADVVKVGVFQDSPLEEVLRNIRQCGLDMAQLHGKESSEYCAALAGMAIKTIKLQEVPVPGAIVNCCPVVLLEAPENAGEAFDWAVARPFAAARRTVIAGGLTPGNVAEAVSRARPFGVDVASGVERSARRKDGELMRSFIGQAREAEREMSG